MGKILGLDLGTNSIGWAIVEKDGGNYQLTQKGVRIFQEGVKIEKGIESSKAAERTGYRSSRRLKYRRKLRKIVTLQILIKFKFCPILSEEDLNNWRFKKTYPQNEDFNNWWRTSELDNKNPYFYRNLAVTQKLDLSKESNRFIIGRAIYHLAQRRGFLSNRLEQTKESDGAVKKAIDEINNAKGNKTLGQYFYEKYIRGEKIRDQYTHREMHYLEEFNKICAFQELPNELRSALHNAVFFQRPLKSQKGLVGKCVFEKNKTRCSASHPLFEEYRMLCFINNIKIKTPYEVKMRFLNDDERRKIINRFYLKRDHFNFEDIAKQLAPQKQYKYFNDRDKNEESYLFNYKMNTSITANPVSARLREIFGENFLNLKIEYIRGKDNKKSYIDINDVWHVLYSFDSDEKLTEFASKRLNLDVEKTEEFLKIRLKNDYASLSLKAIKKILPFLHEGLIYSHAVVLANMVEVLPKEVWNNEIKQKEICEKVKEIIRTQNEDKAIIDIVNSLIRTCRDNGECWSKEAENYFRIDLRDRFHKYYGEVKYSSLPEIEKQRLENEAYELLKKQMLKINGRGEFACVYTIDERVKNYLHEKFNIEIESLKKIYHPSAIETYKPAIRADDGRKYLNSPMVSSIKNPMAMRALHQLRKVINELIKNEIIDEHTKINIEMARGLLNANERKALQSWQRDRESKRKEYAEKIIEHYKSHAISAEPTDDDILKYQLWEEQKHICLYTGNEIALSEFLGTDPKYDIEHTIPRSQSFDNSQENKTLCDNRFNRSVKGNKIPSMLNNHKEILQRIESWKDKIEEIENQKQYAVRQSQSAVDKDSKDKAIQKRHKLTFELNYWRNKFNRFLMEDVPQGFKNSQLVDTGIITKYSRLYLNSLFDNVYTLKGSIVADFRKMWGIQSEYKKKERVNHIHHCIDAIVMACISKENYETLAKCYHDNEELYIKGVVANIKLPKPWETFTQDLKNVEQEVFVSHHTPDVLSKQSKKKLKKGGKIVTDKNGQPVYQQGDTVRGSLHKEMFYGAIERELENKKGEIEKQIKYVIRNPLNKIDDNNLRNIVDDKVREIVIEGRKIEKEFKNELDNLQKKLSKADEQEETDIKLQIERLKKQIENLYTLPNKNGAPVPIKKVRVYTPTVTNPLHLKKQRDKSLKNPKPYKEHYHVVNDGNYLMALYEGKDEKGNIKRDFEIKNYLEAGEYYKLSVRKYIAKQNVEPLEGLVPKVKFAGKLELPFKALVKIGTMVLLWEKEPDEIWEIDQKDRLKRLYKVVGLSINKVKSGNNSYEFGMCVLRYHQEANPASELKTIDGLFNHDEQYIAQRKLSHNQFNALISDYDFKIDALGEINKINK